MCPHGHIMGYLLWVFRQKYHKKLRVHCIGCGSPVGPADKMQPTRTATITSYCYHNLGEKTVPHLGIHSGITGSLLTPGHAIVGEKHECLSQQKYIWEIYLINIRDQSLFLWSLWCISGPFCLTIQLELSQAFNLMQHSDCNLILALLVNQVII